MVSKTWSFFFFFYVFFWGVGKRSEEGVLSFISNAASLCGMPYDLEKQIDQVKGNFRCSLIEVMLVGTNSIEISHCSLVVKK